MAEVLNYSIIAKATQNLGDQPQADGAPVDWDQDNRVGAIISRVVEEVRSNIQSAARYPLSITDGTVPPGAKRHVLNVAAWQVLNSTPNLNMAILTEKGISTPFAQFYRDGKAYIDSLLKGAAVPRPNDPTGQDYINPVNVPWPFATPNPYPTYIPANPINPPVSGIEWSDEYGTSWENAQGFRIDPVTGQKIYIVEPCMNTN